MGSAASHPNCSDLQLTNDGICNIHTCVSRVNGKKSETASPSDIYFIDLTPGTRYGGETIPQEIVVKVFIDPISSVFSPLSVKSPEFGGVYPPHELVYESKVYENVIGPMMVFNFNPHFVSYYGRARGCKAENLGNIWKDRSSLTDEEIKQSLTRNTYFMLKDLEDRPAFDTVNLLGMELPKYNWVFDRLKDHTITFGMICTRRSSGRSMSDWLENVISRGMSMGSIVDISIALLQAVSGLVALESFHCAHNDMHLGNIFVNVLPQSKTRYYSYTHYEDEKNQNDLIYSINTNMEVQLYDWDRAYVNGLGDNPKLGSGDDHSYLCKEYGHCNRYIPQTDLLKLVVNIYNKLPSSYHLIKKIILDAMSPNDQVKTFLVMRIINEPGASDLLVKDFNTRIDRPLTEQELRMFNPPSVFLSRLLDRVIPLTPIVEKIEGLVNLQESQRGDVYNFSRKYISDRMGGYITRAQKEHNLSTERARREYTENKQDMMDEPP
jgi:hypothetical protein